MRQSLTGAAKLAISAVLIWFAFSKIDSAGALALLRSIDPIAAATAIALLAFQQFVAGVRLRRLLALGRSPIGLMTAVDTVFVGAFFSQTPLSIIGGDAVRVWRLKSAGVSAARAFNAIIFDRASGFFMLIAMIVAALPLLLGMMTSTAMRAAVIAAVVLGLLATLAYLLLSRMPAALRKWRAFRVVAETSEYALSVSSQLGEISYLLWLALVMQVVNVVALFAIAAGLGVSTRLLDLFVLVPPVMLLAMLPISFAGWGVREGAMAVSLGLVGIGAEQSIAMSICFGLCAIIVALPGAVLWLAARRSKNDEGP